MLFFQTSWMAAYWFDLHDPIDSYMVIMFSLIRVLIDLYQLHVNAKKKANSSTLESNFHMQLNMRCEWFLNLADQKVKTNIG